MDDRKKYVYSVNFVVSGDCEDCHVQNLIDEKIINALKDFNDAEVEFVSAQLSDLSVSRNYGRCAKCGVWVTHAQLPGAVSAFSDGDVVNGEWYCDLCLSEDHEKHF